MKRKLCKVICLMIVMATCLTGCGDYKLSFGGGKEEAPEETIETPAPTVESLAQGMSYEVGTTINVNDIVTLNPNLLPMQVVFLQNGTEPVETITCDEVGSFTIDVVVQYEDGTSWGDTFSYEVTGKSLEAIFPEGIVTKLMNAEWNVSDTDAGKMSYVNSDTFDDSLIDAMTLEEVEELKEAGMSIFDNPLTLVMIRSFEDMFSGLEVEATFNGEVVESDSEATSEFNDVEQYALKALEELYIISNEELGSYVYDVDGNSYPVYVTKLVTTDAAFGGSKSASSTQAAYFDYNGYRFGVSSPSVLESSSTSTSTDTSTDSSEFETIVQNSAIESYEDFRQLVIDNFEISGLNDVVPEVSTYDSDVEFYKEYFSNILIGDVTPLLPEKEPVETPAEESGEVPTDEEGEASVKVDTNIVDNTQGKYAAHIQSLLDFKEPSVMQFTKWNDVWDKDASYAGVAKDENGNILKNLYKDKEEDIFIPSIGGGSSLGGADSEGGNSEIFEWTLMNSSVEYKVTNANDTTKMVDVGASESNLAVCKVYGTTVLVSLGTADQVDNWKKNCLFNTDMFLNGEWEARTAYADVSSLGNITYYKIKYTDADSEKICNDGYMAVIEDEKATIIVRPTVPCAIEVLEHVCSNMIVKGE